ncbi:MAG: hypothetical protein IJZ17_03605, partial [Muribaculaceae bacterium]|nr:hypothetical protein [Muribaculaceae bacterium]
NKGLYVKLGCKTEAIAHDALNGIIAQERKFYIHPQHFIDEFKEMAAAGYILGSLETSYNKYDNRTYFTVIYDKPQQQYSGKQLIGIFETKDEFIAFLNENVTDKCNITGLWGGWENRDYAAEAARAAAASNESALDVLLGLGNSIMQLTNGGQPSEVDHDNVNNNGHTETVNSSKTKTNVGKCRHCAGSGTCSATSSAGRKNACNGSGLCGHCSGTGWIKAGGSEAKCTACNGTGKCKSCKGTGKCSHCHGTGK